MASNPSAAWPSTNGAKFAGWIREPTPAALLDANIFFDFRPLFGNATLVDRFRSWLLGITQGNRFFLRMMTANALQAEPPPGLIRTFKTDDGEHQGTVDLKQGTRIFVDTARALTLGLGTPDTTRQSTRGAKDARCPRADGRGLPSRAQMDFLEFLDESVAIAFRAEFDETVLTREVNGALGLPQQHTFLDLAVMLPSVSPGTNNDTLDDWAESFGIRPNGRDRAIADAYTNAQLPAVRAGTRAAGRPGERR